MASSNYSNSNTTLHSTGTEVTQHSLIWGIKNFPFIAKEDRLINTQRMHFDAVDGTGHSSQWVVYLASEVRNGNKVICVYYALHRAPPSIPEYFYSQMGFSIKNDRGKIVWGHDTGPTDISNMTTGWGFSFDVGVVGGQTNLEIHLQFRLHTPAKQTFVQVAQLSPSRDESLMKFEMMERARGDLTGLIQVPVPGDTRVKSSDGKVFTMPRGVLAARSPVFGAMFQTDMREANSGIVCFPDMAGKTLEVFLHFIYTGELHPNWKESGVIVELTNAAAKYQLLDLLDFLDFMLGKVCDLKNVAPLLSLANRLGLKTAEGELLKFVREMGTSSPGNFYQIMNVISGMGPLNL